MAGPLELKSSLGMFNPNDLGKWMEAPEDDSQVEGLHWLDSLDHLLIYSYTPVKAMRIFPLAAKRHFLIKNNQGENVYVANEYAGRRKLCGNRSFNVDVLDKEEAYVFSIRSPTNCGVCCGCCVPWIEVVTKDDLLVGSIEQKCSILQQKYMMRDNKGQAVLRVRGPMRPLWCLKHPELTVLSKLSSFERGLIVKVGDENSCEMELVFSSALTTELKAVMLAMGFVFEIRNFKPVPTTERPSYTISRTVLKSTVNIPQQV